MKSILFEGNPFVEQRPTADGNRLNLRLVYKLDRVITYDEETGEARERQRRKSVSLKLWLYATPRTPQERQHNSDTKAAAKIKREEAEREFLRVGRGYKFPTDRSRLNCHRWFADYIRQYDKADKRVIEMAINRFQRYIETTPKYSIFKDTLHPDNVTPEMLRGFVATLERESRGSGAQTIFKRFKKILKAATAEGVFIDNPSNGIVARVEGEGVLRKEVLTGEELNRLLSCKFDRQADEVHRAFIFCLYTGLRFCDVKGLRFCNIDYENKQVHFRQAKTGRTNIVPLRADVLRLIGRGEAEHRVFRLPSANACNKALQRWVDKAGIKKRITWHCARHTFGATTYYYSKDLRTTSELLGHSDIAMTQIYTQIFDERKREAVENLPQIMGVD